jgi:hypothetical protein
MSTTEKRLDGFLESEKQLRDVCDERQSADDADAIDQWLSDGGAVRADE